MKISSTAIVILLLMITVTAFTAGYLLAKNTANNQPTIVENGANVPDSTEPEMKLDQIPGVGENDYIRGNKDAQIVLIEYSDYECPFCKSFHPTMESVMEEYSDQVAWVLRDYPLPFHPKAIKTAEAAAVAGEMGGNEAFWKMSDLMFEEMPNLEVEQLADLASEIGLNKTEFQQALDSGKYEEEIKQEMQIASDAGIGGTPGTVVIAKNGTRTFISGAMPFDQVKAVIDEVLNN